MTANAAAAAPTLHFLMLTHGALAATRRCVRSLAATTGDPFRLWIVDNASTDGTPEWLAGQQQPWLRWRRNAENRGVPGGRNDLLDFVLPAAAPHDWLVFVDNDLEFHDGWLASFERAMRAFPNARVLGKVGHFVQVHATGRTLLPAADRTGHVDVVSGGFACFVRADAARAIGRFDERLGLFWHEDDDWCVRALQLGFDVVAVPEAAIDHHEHASGVATGGVARGGSPSNQQYLAAKWRTAGQVDRDGWIVRQGGPYVPPPVRDDLRRRLGRDLPIGRTELAAATALLEALVDQEQPARWLEHDRRPLPPCTLALLDLQRSAARQLGETELVARLDRIAAALPDAGNAVRLRRIVRAISASCDAPAGHGVLRASDYDDPDFRRVAAAVAPGPQLDDPHARTATHWESVAIALAADRAGVALAGARVLFAGEAPTGLPAAFARLGAEVHEYAVGLQASEPFQLLVVTRVVNPDDVQDLLARHAGDRTLVVFSGDVVLNGAPSRDEPQPHQLELDLMARAGLRPQAPVALATDAAALEAYAQSRARPSHPLLTWANGPRLCTSFVVGCRRAPAAARPAVLVPARAAGRATLKVGVDLRTLFRADSTARGIGKYTEQHLAALCDAEPGLRLVGYVDRGDELLPAALRRPAISTASVDDYRPDDVALVHVPDPMNLSFGFDAPLRVLRHARTTVTFHDLTPLHHYLDKWPRANREAYLDRLRQIEKSRCLLLTNSRYTADDVLRRLTVSRDRVIPILAGLHHGGGQAQGITEIAAVLRDLGVCTPFVLHVGAHDPHKNFPTALNAFLRVRARRPLQLVVVGAVDPGMAEAAAFCAMRGVPDVVFTGYLPRRHLDALYASATALLFLSRAEGFGFPILEAMAKGCPVIASNATSHPEVAGDAALLVDADDQAGVAAHVERLLQQPAFAGALRESGRRRAQTFPWRAVAERTLDAWRKLTAARPTAGPAPGSALTPR